MIRFGSIVLCTALATGLLACGSSTPSDNNPVDSSTPSNKNPIELVPASNAVSGWSVDKEHSKNADGTPMTATDQTGVIGLIDGGGEAYFAESYEPKLFIWQPYVNSTLTSVPDGAQLDFRLVQYPSAEQAKGLYAAVVKMGDYARREWQPTSPTFGTESRIQDTTSQWWINFYKDAYYVEIVVDPSSGPAPDFTPGNEETKKAAIDFAKAVVSKM
jgi:hypothetical protein